MPLDPQAAAIIDLLAAAGGPAVHEGSPEEARALYKSVAQARVTDDPLESVDDRTIPGPAGDLGIRVYRPTPQNGLPVVVWFHGGGWVIGDLDTHDALCASLASRSGCTVVSVDYRLAPEARFPEPLEDCYSATRWVADNGDELGVDASRLAVAGDSAGGNLATATCLLARERGGPAIAFQLLVYPVTDHSFSQPSYVENATGYFLTADAMRWFSGHYLADPGDAKDPLAAPLEAPDLGGLPPALVITAEFDPLRDEGEAYGRRLDEAGVPATVHRYDGMIHGFVSMFSVLDAGAAARDECAAALRSALRP